MEITQEKIKQSPQPQPISATGEVEGIESSCLYTPKVTLFRSNTTIVLNETEVAFLAQTLNRQSREWSLL